MEISIDDISVEKRRITIELFDDLIVITSLYDDEAIMVCEVKINDFKNALKFLEENGRK